MEEERIRGNRVKLYEALSDHVSNIGSFEEFSDRMDKESNRRKVYELARNRVENIGSWDEFNSRIYGAGESAGKEIVPGEYGMPGVTETHVAGTPSPQEAVEDSTPFIFDAVKARQLKESRGMAGEIERQGAQLSENIERLRKANTAEGYRQSQLAGVQSRMMGLDPAPLGFNGRGSAAPEDSGTPGEEGGSMIGSITGPVVHDVVTDNGRSVKRYMLPDGSLTTDWSEANDAARNAADARRLHAALNDIGVSEADIDRRLEEISREMSEDADSYGREKGFMPDRRDLSASMSSGLVPLIKSIITGDSSHINEWAAPTKDMDRLASERDILTEAKHRLKLAGTTHKSNGFFDMNNVVNFWAGIKDRITSADFYDFGNSDLRSAGTLLNIKRKIEDDETLSDKDINLLKAAILSSRVNGIVDQAHGVTAGQTTADMLPFVAELMMNPASGISKKMVKNMVRRYGREGARAMAMRIGAKAVGQILEAGGAAVTTQSAKTAADAINRHLGEVGYDAGEDRYEFTDGESGLTAAYKAVTAGTIENWTEIAVGDLLKWGTAGIGRHASRGLERMGLGSVNSLISRVKASEFSQAIERIEKKAHWNGTLEEIIEEETAIPLNAWLVGDNSLSDLTDIDRQIDIVLGVGLFGGAISAVKTGHYGYTVARSEYEMKRASSIASVELTGERWQEIRETIDGLDGVELKDSLVHILSDDGISEKGRRAVMRYAKALVRSRGVNIMAEKRRDGSDGLERDVNDSFSMGYGSEDSPERADIENMYQYQRGLVVERFGESFVNSMSNYIYDPVSFLREILYPGEGYSREDIELLKDYINARSARNGVLSRVADDIEEAVLQNNYRIDRRMNTHMGRRLVRATVGLDNRSVYIVDGHVALNDDGSIDRGASTRDLIVLDENGQYSYETVDKVISIDGIYDADAYRSQTETEIRESFARRAADNINGVLAFNPGDVVTVSVDGSGLAEVTVSGPAIDPDSGMPDAGRVIVQAADGTRSVYTRGELQQMADAARQKRLRDFERRRAGNAGQSGRQYALNDEFTIIGENGMPIRGSVTGELNEDGMIGINTERPVNGRLAGTYTPAELNRMIDTYIPYSTPAGDTTGDTVLVPDTESAIVSQQEVPAESPAINTPGAVETALSRIPVDDRGEPVFEEAGDMALAWDALVEDMESEEDAGAWAEGMVKRLDKEIKAARKAYDSIPADGDRNEFRRRRAEARAALESVMARADRWREIAGIRERRAQESMLAEKERLARAKAEEDERIARERAAEEEWRQERQRLDRPVRDVADMVRDCPEALDLLGNMEPMDIHEAAAMVLSGHRILLNDSGVRRGTRRLLGMGNAESRKLFGLFAGKEKGGVSLEYLAGDIMKETCGTYGIAYENDAALDALMDVVQTSNTVGDIRSYIVRHRITQAKECYDQWLDRLREDEDLYYRERYHMSKEKLEAYEEVLERSIDELTEDDLRAVDEIFADADTLKNKDIVEQEKRVRYGREQFAGPSDSGGGTEVLPGSPADRAGGSATVKSGGSQETGITGAGQDGDAPAGASRTEAVSNARGADDRRREYGPTHQDNLPREEVNFSEDTDHNGLPFLTSSDGTTTFGAIRVGEGIPAGSIRLSIGFDRVVIVDGEKKHRGYGYEHIDAQRGDVIRAAGFKNIVEFVEYVSKNYASIHKGGKRNGKDTFIIEVPQTNGKDTNVLYIELSTDGEYWNVNSGGIFRSDYTRNKVVVVRKEDSDNSLPALETSSATVDGKVQDTTEGGNPLSGDSSLSESSDSKITNSASDKQENGAKSSIDERIKAAGADVDTAPTPAQKEAGNYKKGHVTVGRFNITIENPAGSTRSGVDANGKEWSTTMANTYGYIKDTEGVDGDHIDVFLHQDMNEWNERKVYVVDQTNTDGSFDEHKVMLGFNDKDEAMSAYLANYDAGWAQTHPGLRISETSIGDFNKWVQSSKRKTKPFADYSTVSKVTEQSASATITGKGYDQIASRPTYDIERRTDSDGTEYYAIRLKKGFKDRAAWKAIAEKHDGIYSTSEGRGVFMFYNGRESMDAFLREVVANERSAGEENPRFDMDNTEGNRTASEEVCKVARGMLEAAGIDVVEVGETEAQAMLKKQKTTVADRPNRVNEKQTSGDVLSDKSFSLPADLGIVGAMGGNRFSISNKDAEYLDAVARGDLKTAQRLVAKAATEAGYIPESDYQGSSAYNGSAPFNGYGWDKTERKKLWENDEFEGDWTLGDDIDFMGDSQLNFLLNHPNGYYSANKMQRESIIAIREAIKKGNRKITVYRSVPDYVEEGSLRNGDWVTPSLSYAKDNATIHGWGTKYRIIEQEVDFDELWWDGNDVNEWGYDSDSNLGYKNTRNNRKLLDAVTYDDNGEVIPLSERFNAGNEDVRYLKDGKGVVYGWTVGGTVYLNRDAMNPETPLHEYTHLWDDMVRRENPELWARGMKLLRQTPLWNNVVNDPAYADIAGDENAVASEVHARMTGERGAEILEEMIKDATGKDYIEQAKVFSLVANIRKWLGDMFKCLRTTLGKWSGRDLRSLTLDDFNNMTLRDLAQGINPENVEKSLADVHDISEVRQQNAITSRKSSESGLRFHAAMSDGREKLGEGKQKELDGYLREHASAPVVIINNNDVDGLDLPEEVKNGLRGIIADGDYPAVYCSYDKKVYIFADIESNCTLSECLAHDNTHAVVDALGDSADGFLNELRETICRNDSSGLFSRFADAVLAVYDNAYLNEEFAAYMVQLSEINQDRFDYIKSLLTDELRNKFDEILIKNVKGREESILVKPQVSRRVHSMVPLVGDNGLHRSGIEGERGAYGGVLQESETGNTPANAEDVLQQEESGVNGESGDGETLLRTGDGYGAYSDADVSYANDPVSKVMGRNRFSPKRQAEFAARERKRMAIRIQELAERMRLDNVDVITDVSQLDGKRAKAKGFYNKRTGKITIVIPNNLSTIDAEQTLLHEAVAHYGLRQLFGEQFNTFLDNVYESADKEIRRTIAELAARNGWDFRTATEEYLAGLAEDVDFERAREHAGWWSRIRQLFIDMVDRIGFNGFRDSTGVVLGDNELRYILWRSYENLAEPGRSRSILGEAADVAMQSRLKVGNYAEGGIEAEYAAEPIGMVNTSFNNQLERYISGELTKQEMLHLGNPRGVMRNFLPDLPIVMRQRVIKKGSEKKHEVDVTALIDMPEYLSLPIFVFQRSENTIGILTDIKDRHGKNVCVAIELKRQIQNGNEYLEVNDVRSFHGREFKNIVGPIVNNNTLKWVDKEKGLAYLSSASQQVQQEIDKQALEDATKIVENFENPAIEEDELFRPGDFSPRDKALARDYYESMCRKSSWQVQESLQDSMLGLKTLYKSILGKDTLMKDVAGFENAYLFENRMSSVNQSNQHHYFQRYMKSVLEEVGKIAGVRERKRQELTDYLMAKHGLERNEYMRNEAAANGKDTDRDFAGLMGLTGEADWQSAEATAQQWVDDYESTHDTTALWEAINRATKATLTTVYMSGMISKDTYEKIRDMYKYYIPLRGWDETTSDQVYGYFMSNNGPLGGSIMKKAAGRKSKADDPIATIAKMADEAIRQGNRNLMKQRFLNFVLNHPSDAVSVHDLWLEHNEVTDEWEPVFADIKESDTADEAERKVKAFEERMEALHTAEPHKYKRGREAQHIPYKVVRSNLREHQILIKRNGRTFVVTINGNPRAAQAINGLTNPDTKQDNFVWNALNVASWINRQLSAAYTTRNPAFVMGNFIRDMLYSNCMAWVKENPRYALQFHKNFGKFSPISPRRSLRLRTGVGGEKVYSMGMLFRKWEKGTLDMTDKYEKMFYDFMMNGGETGYTNVKNIDGYKRTIVAELKKQNNIGRKAWSALGMQLELLNRSVENCARFAAFVTSRESGRTIDRSIYDAKEISVNFNKKGSGSKMANAVGQTRIGKITSQLSGWARALYIFWNAGIQGVTNFGQQAGRHTVKFTTAMSSLFALGYIIPILAEMMGDGDDDDKNAYYNLPEYVRRSNICIRAGDQWITIPLPIEFRAIYGLGELGYGTASGGERYSNSELAYQIASQVSQILPLDMLEGGGGLHPLIPSAAKPISEAYLMNKSWTGMPIYKETPYNENDPEWTKAYASTDKHLVDFARWLNETTGGDDFKKGEIDINPAKIEYLLNGTFGGLVSFPNQVKKMAETILGDRDFEWRNMPLASRVVKSGDERTAYRKLQNEYFRYMDEYEETGRLVRKYTKASNDGIMGYAEKVNFLQNSDEYLRWRIFDSFKPMIDEYREIISLETDKDKKKQAEIIMYTIMRKLIDALHSPDEYIQGIVEQ